MSHNLNQLIFQIYDDHYDHNNYDYYNNNYYNHHHNNNYTISLLNIWITIIQSYVYSIIRTQCILYCFL